MARSLQLEVSGNSIETPNCFLYTRCGYPPSITDDIFSEFPSPLLLHLSFPDVYVVYRIKVIVSQEFIVFLDMNN